MASLCVNTVAVPSENFIDCAPAAFPAYKCLTPTISFSRDYADDDSTAEASDPPKDADFDFLLDDSVAMLPADELFSDGKLMPLKHAAVRPALMAPVAAKSAAPKAPQRCASRWRDLLGLKKLYQNSNKANSSSSSTSTTTTSSSSTQYSGKSVRQFLLRNSVTSSRISLSSSSSGHDFDDLPLISLDSDSKNSQSHGLGHPRVRIVKPRMIPKPIRRAQQDPATVTTGISVDSPRMSSSGKIVFQSLERSSSSPSSFNGGTRYKNRGMERSYSANVRVTPVLNVFGLFSSQSQKKEANSSGSSKAHYHYRTTSRVRKESC